MNIRAARRDAGISAAARSVGMSFLPEVFDGRYPWRTQLSGCQGHYGIDWLRSELIQPHPRVRS